MGRFRIHMTGVGQPLIVELDADCVNDLAQMATQARFICGNLAEPNEDGCLPSIMIAAGRISAALVLD